MAVKSELFPTSFLTQEMNMGEIARTLFAELVERNFRQRKRLLETVRLLCTPAMLNTCEAIGGFEYDDTAWYFSDSLEKGIKAIPLSEALDVLETITVIPVYLNENHCIDSWDDAPFLKFLRAVLPDREPLFLEFLDTMIKSCPDAGSLESEIFPQLVSMARLFYL